MMLMLNLDYLVMKDVEYDGVKDALKHEAPEVEENEDDEGED
jgi:hypothetical protein